MLSLVTALLDVVEHCTCGNNQGEKTPPGALRMKPAICQPKRAHGSWATNKEVTRRRRRRQCEQGSLMERRTFPSSAVLKVWSAGSGLQLLDRKTVVINAASIEEKNCTIIISIQNEIIHGWRMGGGANLSHHCSRYPRRAASDSTRQQQLTILPHLTFATSGRSTWGSDPWYSLL